MITKFTDYIKLNEELEKVNTIDSKYVFFCDLDGVLVDFKRGFIELSTNPDHLSIGEFEKKYGKPAAFKLIDEAGVDFWKNLNWTEDGKELWDYLKQYNPIILSSPTTHESSKIGKAEWIKLNLGIDVQFIDNPLNFNTDTRIIFANHKHDYVKPAISLFEKTPVLIDDYRKKLDKWALAGGIGIYHNDSTDTIKSIESSLLSL